MNTLHHVGISGGKDSTALLLWMVRESGIDPKTILATFCDTDNEHPLTYAQIRTLSETVHPIQTIYPPRGFFELAFWKHRFPGVKSRFCTIELKIKPTQNLITRLRARGWDKIVMCSGVRGAESFERSKLVEREPKDDLIEEWRPLLKWSLSDIWAIHKRHGVPPNPLYAMGARRVGCYPCIMSRKQEIAVASVQSPETFDRIRAAENSDRWPNDGFFHGFFSRDKIPQRFHSRKIVTRDGRKMTVCTIDDVIAWATEDNENQRRQLHLPITELKQDAMDHKVCPSNLGYCE